MPSFSKGKDAAYWLERIHAVGSRVAYEEFIDFARSHPFKGVERHQAEHEFGKALYKVEGFSGMAICRWDEAAGCVHQLAGERIGEFGLDALPDFDVLCDVGSDTQNANCMHGIGHGLLSAIGYGVPELSQAVDLCARAKVKHAVDACQSGAFMEYNMRNLLNGNASGVRKADTNLAAPCDSFSGMAQENCAFTQYVWFKSFSPDLPLEKHYSTMGEYCTILKTLNQSSVYQCFNGIGYDASRVSVRSLTKGREFCAYAAQGDASLERACDIRLEVEINLSSLEDRMMSE